MNDSIYKKTNEHGSITTVVIST